VSWIKSGIAKEEPNQYEDDKEDGEDVPTFEFEENKVHGDDDLDMENYDNEDENVIYVL
jgi:hypothetical protein